MTDTTDLIQRLSDEADLCRNDGATDVAKLIDDAVFELVRQMNNVKWMKLRVEQQAAQIEALQLTKAGLIGSLREEMDEGLRLRELGGALPNENITAMTERLIGERAALAAELSALRADAARYAFIRARWTHCTFAWNKDSANSLKSIGLTIKTACPVKASSSSLDREIDAALRQEQPNE